MILLLSLKSIASLLGLAIALSLAKIIFHGLTNPLRHIPGPFLSRFTHLRLKLAVISGQRVHYIHALHQNHGPYVRVSPEEISIADPKSFPKIYSIKSALEKNRWYADSTGGFPRPTLFSMQDNKSHSTRRKLFARSFSKSHTRAHWEEHIHQRVELTISSMQREAGQFGTVDVLKWFTLMASDISSHLMFGESFHTLEQGEMNEFMRYLTKASIGGAIGNELPLLRTIGRLLPLQITRELFNTNTYLADYAELAVRNMKSQSGSTGKNLFASAQAEAEKGECLDDVDVKLEALSLFVAGTDTTAISLTYLVWAVLKRPDLRRELEREVAGLEEGYEDQDVEELPLLNGIIEETLRLYGAAPGALPRDVPAGGMELGGYYLPEGSVVSTQAFSLHRDPELWPEPLEFKPSRWIDADGTGRDGKVSTAARAVFNPFGSGSRGCLGQHIAYSELRLAAAEFFRRCPGARLAESTTDESMEMHNFFLIQPKAHRCEVVV